MKDRTFYGRGSESTGKKPQKKGNFLARLHAFELELLDAIADLIAVQAEQRRGPRLVPAAALERLHDQRALELLEIDAVRRQLHTAR